MNRKEKYQFLKSMGLSSELARKWRDRRINEIETRDKNTILKSNPELKKEYNNYMVKVRYHFLRGMGLTSERARTFRKHKKIDVTGLKLHKKDRKSTRLNSSHVKSSYAVFCLK